MQEEVGRSSLGRFLDGEAVDLSAVGALAGLAGPQPVTERGGKSPENVQPPGRPLQYPGEGRARAEQWGWRVGRRQQASWQWD